MRVIVDSHLHVWDLAAGAYPWLGPQHGVLYRSFSPREAGAVLAEHGVSSAVLVQAEDTVEETERLLVTAREEEWAAGVVGWVPLDKPVETSRLLERLDAPELKGVRHLVHDDPRDDFFELASVRHSLSEIAERGLVLDVPDAWPRHLTAIAALADALPDLTIVVDHLGKPPRGGDLAGWEHGLREAARHPRVHAKLSGLQVTGQPCTAGSLARVVDTAVDAFSPTRLMYGGDWPMTVVHGGYPEMLEALAPLVDELSPAEQAAIWHGTATTTYGLAHGGAR